MDRAEQVFEVRGDEVVYAAEAVEAAYVNRLSAGDYDAIPDPSSHEAGARDQLTILSFRAAAARGLARRRITAYVFDSIALEEGLTCLKETTEDRLATGGLRRLGLRRWLQLKRRAESINNLQDRLAAFTDSE